MKDSLAGKPTPENKNSVVVKKHSLAVVINAVQYDAVWCGSVR